MCEHCDHEEAIKLCDNILADCECLPERAEDFCESVTEKVESIREWIETNEHVTPAQLESLENMQSGVSRWIEH